VISFISPNVHVGLESMKTRFTFPGTLVFKDADPRHTLVSQVRVMCCSVIGAVAIHGGKSKVPLMWARQGGRAHLSLQHILVADLI